MNNSLYIVILVLILGATNACNSCEKCITLAQIMQEIDSDTERTNVLPSQIQILRTTDFVDVKVQAGGVSGWNKRSKRVLLEKYKICQKKVEDANLELPGEIANCDPCRKHCPNLRFYPIQKEYSAELKKYVDIFEYKSRKGEFVCGKSTIPVLEGTFSTSPTRLNSLEAGKDVNNGNVKNSWHIFIN